MVGITGICSNMPVQEICKTSWEIDSEPRSIWSDACLLSTSHFHTSTPHLPECFSRPITRARHGILNEAPMAKAEIHFTTFKNIMGGSALDDWRQPPRWQLQVSLILLHSNSIKAITWSWGDFSWERSHSKTSPHSLKESGLQRSLAKNHKHNNFTFVAFPVQNYSNSLGVPWKYQILPVPDVLIFGTNFNVTKCPSHRPSAWYSCLVPLHCKVYKVPQISNWNLLACLVGHLWLAFASTKRCHAYSSWSFLASSLKLHRASNVS